MYSVEQLKEAVGKSECWSDVCRSLNITVCTFNFKRMQRLCKENEIPIDHFDLKKAFRRNKRNWDPQDIYVEGSLFSRSHLRQRIMKDGFLPYCCNSCGNEGEWKGKKLTLEIEHINGINDDNRKQNLIWLCPNCHSQTSTYRNSSNRKGL